MRSRYTMLALGIGAVALALAGCTDKPGTNPSTSATSTSTTTQDGAGNEAPKVQNPLPAKVLDGSPCDSALTSADVTEFIGTTDPAKPRDDVTGPACSWHNSTGTDASIGVSYYTKISDGLSSSYRNVKPKALFWKELAPIQGYPVVSYLLNGEGGSETSACAVDVGISDSLSYSADIVLSNNAQQKGVKPCDAARDVADRVLTNIKKRA